MSQWAFVCGLPMRVSMAPKHERLFIVATQESNCIDPATLFGLVAYAVIAKCLRRSDNEHLTKLCTRSELHLYCRANQSCYLWASISNQAGCEHVSFKLHV